MILAGCLLVDFLWALASALEQFARAPASSDLGRAGVVGERVALLPQAWGKPRQSYASFVNSSLVMSCGSQLLVVSW